MTDMEIKWLVFTPIKVFFDCDKQSLKKNEEEWFFKNKDIIEVTARRECFGNSEKNYATVLIYFNKK